MTALPPANGRCQQVIYKGLHGGRCRNAAAFVEKDGAWCSLHTPSLRLARRQKKAQDWANKKAGERAAREREVEVRRLQQALETTCRELASGYNNAPMDPIRHVLRLLDEARS